MENRLIFDLKADEARQHFLTHNAYFSLPLPAYYDFESMLKKIDCLVKKSNSKANAKGYRGLMGNKSHPGSLEGVNYTLYHNKDGKYDWRPFQIINPVIYVSLVNEMFTEENWNTIVGRVKGIEGHDESCVECKSVPIVSSDDPSESRSEAKDQILNWWMEIEQKSIELSLDFDYVFHADIADCYGSIYTHSIAWAIHEKETAKSERNDKELIGNIIDQHITAMSYGQTNGIPQGSVLMDLIAELVLFYGDELIRMKIKEKETISSKDFKILRYRDDYRIFTKEESLGNELLKIISQELRTLGFKLNSAKTSVSSDVITSSIKKDKLASLSLHQNYNMQKRLLLLKEFSLKYPNSGTLKKELSGIKKKIDAKKNDRNDNIPVLISILTDIIYHNTTIFVEATSILSSLFARIDDEEARALLIKKVYNKLSRLNNHGYFEIWFKRAIIKEGIKTINYNECLCDENVDCEELFNYEWIGSEDAKVAIKKIAIINQAKLSQMSAVTEYSEVGLFDNYSRYIASKLK